MGNAGEVRFDGWTVRSDSGELSKNGRTLRLRKQPMKVLEALLARPGSVVTRDELIALLWPKGLVNFDMALNSAVRRLRSALDDEAAVPRYIETLPRRGYRFIGSLELEPSSLLLARVEMHPGAPRASSVSKYVIRAFVALVALGTFALLGRDGRWAQVDPIARPLPDSSFVHQFDARKPSSNPRAMEHYLRARYFLQRRAMGDLEHAREHFEGALEFDPNFAEAAAGLASAYWLLLTQNALPLEVGAAKMQSAAKRAVELDPTLPEAHRRLVGYARLMGLPPREEDVRGAEDIDPKGAETLTMRSSEARSRGQLEESIKLARRAVEAEPLSLVYRYNLAFALFLAGRYEEAKRINLEVLEVSPTFRAEIAAQSMILQGDPEGALRLAETWPETAERREMIALAHYALRNTAEADNALAELLQKDRDGDPLRIVEVYAFRSEASEAFRWLDVSTQVFGGERALVTAGRTPDEMRFSPFLEKLRGDPRWQTWESTLPANWR